MKVKELDTIISEVLEQETKKLIKEQITEVDHVLDAIKSFQSLSNLQDKISEIEDAGSKNLKTILIQIKDIKPEELVDCCGGSSLQEALKNLMQGIHHDLEDNGFGSDLDVDIDTSGDENSLNLVIRITTNNDKILSDMKEETKDTNPTIDDKKDVILGGVQPQEPTEQWQAVAGEAIAGEVLSGAELSPVVNKIATSALGSKIADALGGNDEEEVDEELGEEKKNKKWIQKAVNPKHKGYCTPMTKPTCTPKREALAKRFKKGIETNESMKKKIIKLNETEMAEFLKKIIQEAVVAPSGGVLPGGVPGLDIAKKSRSDSGKENNEALKAVEEKIKKYLSFKGNDNPEFPNQIGMGDEKAARVATSDEEQFIDDNRGRGPQDLDYQNEPSDKFKERLKLSLVGDSLMGNPADAANAIKTDVGKKMHKNIERRQKIHKKEPIYPKEPVPVKTKSEEELRPVNEEIERMKQMSSYNKKTQ